MDSNDKIIEEIRKYTDPYSILAIAGKKLIRIRTPFKARVRIDFATLKSGDIVTVEKVMITRQLWMVFIVKGAGYHHFLFSILVD